MKEKQLKKNFRPLDYFLNGIEKVGNLLPDPAILFLLALVAVWLLTAALSPLSFETIDPRTGLPLQIKNLLTSASLTDFITRIVSIFTSFPPLGIVLVMMIGISVLEHSGFINTAIKVLLTSTSKKFLTPILCLAGILSHTAVDAGYVLLIPLGGLIFKAAGRHPLAGIAAAFAGVSGGFSANMIPAPIDLLLQSFTQSAAQIIDPQVMVNPLCNYYFTIASSFLIIGLTWLITDKVVEPRLASLPYADGEEESDLHTKDVTKKERRALIASFIAIIVLIVLFILVLVPSSSPFRSPEGGLTDPHAPLMKAMVSLLFLVFLIIGLVFGVAAGTITSPNDVIKAMVKTMQGMGHYIVMVFFCALFVDAFTTSNLGAVMSVQGSLILKELHLPPILTIIGLIFLCAFLNLFIGSASAKWAMIAPIFVTMLMQLGISPEFTQAAYRIGDSSTNIITPLNPYFPLVVVYCQRFVQNTRIGTVVAMMLPYAIIFLISWSIFLIGFWLLDIPLGINGGYIYSKT